MWNLAGKELPSRLLLGTAQYPSLQTMCEAIQASNSAVITVALKRQAKETHESSLFFKTIKKLPCYLLPNTAGCRTADDAIKTAQIAQELFETHWIKLEVIGDDYTLQPDPFELIKAATMLVKLGFEVFPYCTDDLVLCQRLIDSGCRILMPWAAPIGSGMGIINSYALQTLRNRLPNVTLIVDAGLGKPSEAARAMEMGYDGILLNSAISGAKDPLAMASAFQHAVLAGRSAYKAGLIPVRNIAYSSTALLDTPFWHQEKIS